MKLKLRNVTPRASEHPGLSAQDRAWILLLNYMLLGRWDPYICSVTASGHKGWFSLKEATDPGSPVQTVSSVAKWPHSTALATPPPGMLCPSCWLLLGVSPSQESEQQRSPHPFVFRAWSIMRCIQDRVAHSWERKLLGVNYSCSN